VPRLLQVHFHFDGRHAPGGWWPHLDISLTVPHISRSQLADVGLFSLGIPFRSLSSPFSFAFPPTSSFHAK